MAIPPVIPQRPQRSKPPTATADVPSVPPRPKRSLARSESPALGDSFAPSPLNHPDVFPQNGRTKFPARQPGYAVPKDVVQRPPSVTLPSLGEEGSEYAHLEHSTSQDASTGGASGGVEQTKTIAGDLPLHAPKASLPVSTAKSRIQAVTRTDSNSAAALGIGKPSSVHSDTDHAAAAAPTSTQHPPPSSLHGTSISRSSSAQRSRPTSLYKPDNAETEEQGIPEIGMQIPLYPNAGDVQAPTPSAGSAPPATGVGFFNKGDVPTTPRHHFRTKSGREVWSGPPGSYGLRGHGLAGYQSDPFEKAWYDKHPEAKAREAQGEYGPKIKSERKEYNLSSAELNKLVYEDVVEPLITGTPDEQIGYLATDEIAQRMVSPRPASAAKRRSFQCAESPLRQVHEGPKISVDEAVDDDAEVIHVDHPVEEYVPADEEDVAEVEEAPILAADEVAQRPEAQYLTPAVELDHERRGSSYFGEPVPSNSRPHSRSNSVQYAVTPALRQPPDERGLTGTPLEGVKEYEPLFPEDEEENPKKRPESIKEAEDAGPRHQFRSNDVWEDAPDSLLYETTVKTPQLPEFSIPEAEHEPKEIFETSESDNAGAGGASVHKIKSNNLLERYKSNNLVERYKQKSHFNKDILAEMGAPVRSAVRHKFPSQDMWEDAPQHHLHTTTIEPDDEPDEEAVKEKQDMPNVPARPARRSSAEKGKPLIPARRPARLARTTSGDSGEDAVARSEDGGAPVKTKPPVPARPQGKIAALKGSFMTDLESRLAAGPLVGKGEKKEDVEEEPVPAPQLADARKGRARGPARRKPGVAGSPSPAAGVKEAGEVVVLSLVGDLGGWSVGQDGAVAVRGVGGKGGRQLVKEVADSAEEVGPKVTVPEPAEEVKEKVDVAVAEKDTEEKEQEVAKADVVVEEAS